MEFQRLAKMERCQVMLACTAALHTSCKVHAHHEVLLNKMQLI